MNKFLGLVIGFVLCLIGSSGISYAQEESGGISRLDELIIYNTQFEVIERIQFPADGPLEFMPQVIVPDNTFYVKLRGTNIGASVDRGGFLTLSVAYPYGQMPKPSLQIYNDSAPTDPKRRYIITGDNPNDKLVLNPNLWATDEIQTIRPNYPLVETWPLPWLNSTAHEMMVSVTLPEGYAGAQFRLRSRMSLFAYEHFEQLRSPREQNSGLVDPQYGETEARDEQGYPVWETVVTVGGAPTAAPIVTAPPVQDEAPVMATTAPAPTMPRSFAPENRFWFFVQIILMAIGVVAASFVLLRFIQGRGFFTQIVLSLTLIIALSGLLLIIVLILASAEQFGDYVKNPLWTGLIIALVPALVGGIFNLIRALIQRAGD